MYRASGPDGINQFLIDLRCSQSLRGFGKNCLQTTIALVSAFMLTGLFQAQPLFGRTPQLPVDRSDDAFLIELERRQLFAAITWHCQQQWQNAKEHSAEGAPSDSAGQANPSTVSQGQLSALASRWIRAKTLIALNSEIDSSESAWQEVESLSERLVAESQFYPQHFLVRFQASVIGLARARLANLSAGGGAASLSQREAGLAAVRLSLERLEKLKREVLNASASAPARSDSDPYGAFSRPELQALARDIDFQILTAFGIRAQLYDSSAQASRLDTYQQMVDQAAELQPQLPIDSLLWWQAQATVLDAFRGLQDWKKWDERWNSGVIGKAPPEVLGSMAAARLQMWLDRQDLQKSQQAAKQFYLLLEIRDRVGLGQTQSALDFGSGTAWPEWDIARARLNLELAKDQDQRAGDSNSTQRLAAESSVLEFSKTIAQRHGAFWAAQLTKQLLGGGSNPGLGAPAVSLLFVREKIAAEQWNDVNLLMQQGIEQARNSANETLAFELAKLAAASAKASGPAPWMVQRIEQATLAFPSANQADAIHHYANILSQAITARAPEYLDSQIQVWLRHIDRWPNASTTPALRLQLGNIYLSQKKHALALQIVEPVLDSQPNFGEAVSLQSRIFSQWMFALKVQGQAEQAEAAAAQWSAIWYQRLRRDDDWIRQWSLPQKHLALLLIQAEVESEATPPVWTRPLMYEVKERLPELNDELFSRFQMVQLLLDFRQTPATVQVPDLLSSGNDASSPNAILFSDLQWLIASLRFQIPASGLSQAMESANQRGQTKKASQLLLAAVQKCFEFQAKPDATLTLASEPYFASRRELEELKIRALLQVDRFSEAKIAATDFAAQAPQSLTAQQLLGYTLVGSNDPSDARAAEKQWRMIAHLTPEGTDAWFEAKYYLAEALRRQGQNANASKVLGYLKLTHAQAWQNSRHAAMLNRLLSAVSPK